MPFQKEKKRKSLVLVNKTDDQPINTICKKKIFHEETLYFFKVLHIAERFIRIIIKTTKINRLKQPVSVLVLEL